MTFWKWSQTAASNGTADSTCQFPEGMSPSAVNDGTRGMMAALAKFRDDNGGNLTTAGTSTAYTLASNQGFDSQAHMNAQAITFQVNATNGASPTLNVDGLGASALMMDGANAVPTGTLIAGAVYTAVYYSAVNQWRLKDFYQVPFVVPIGSMIDYFGTTSPSSNFVFPYGQAISRTTYAGLFSLFGTTYGTGDGTTTFNIPDLRGRVVAGKDDMGGSAASRLTSTYFGTSAATLGAAGGAESKVIVTANLPPYTPAGTNSHNLSGLIINHIDSSGFAGGSGAVGITTTSSNNIGVAISGTVTFAGTAQGGTSTPVAIAQPTIIANKLIRII